MTTPLKSHVGPWKTFISINKMRENKINKKKMLITGVSGLLGNNLAYYFRKKFGKERWSRYVPVVAAGFACGTGLSGMTAVAVSLIANCVRELPF